MEKLIMPEVIIDVDLRKPLIKSYNPKTKAFHRNDMSILCRLDRETFIEVFHLGGPMTKAIKMEKMNETFKSSKNFFIGRVMKRHIPKSKLEKVEMPKKVGDLMPLELFCKYFRYTIFGINKVIGIDGTNNASSYIYIIDFDI